MRFLFSYYPWFELFYNVLNDLSQIINSKTVKNKSEVLFFELFKFFLKVTEVERFLSLLYNYKLKTIEEFYKNEGQEIIEITNFIYSRPDQRKLPSMLSNV